MGLDVQGFGFGDGLSFGSFGFHPPSGSVVDTESMIFDITTSSDTQTFQISGEPSFNNYDVDWGDGASDSGVTDSDKAHVYAVAGLYTIKITGSIYIRNNVTPYAAMYTEWKQWGTNTLIKSTREWFSSCTNMSYTATDSPNLDFSGAVSTYRSMYRMFYNCDNITALDLTAWDISATSGNIIQCFANLNKLETLDISGWDVSGATSANSMFELTGAATGVVITANNLNWTNGTTFSRTFYQTRTTSLILNNWTFKTGVSLGQMFRSLSYNSFIGQVELDLSTWNISNVGSMASMFLNARGLKNINITNWDISSITNLSGWFDTCTNIEKIIGLNTLRANSNVSLSQTFNNCYLLSFTTDNFHNDFAVNPTLTNTNLAFYSLGRNLAEADRGAFPNVTNWNMENVTVVNQMFRRGEFANGSIHTASWNLASYSGSFYLFFYECLGLSEIDWTNVTLRASAGVTDMSAFTGRGNTSNTYLTSVKFGANCNFQDVGRWNFSFRNNINMTTLQFDSSVDFSSVTQMTDMLKSVPLDTQYYDALLVGLDATNNNNSVSLNANLCNYTLGSAAETSRTQLVTGQSWTITDAGGV